MAEVAAVQISRRYRSLERFRPLPGSGSLVPAVNDHTSGHLKSSLHPTIGGIFRLTGGDEENVAVSQHYIPDVIRQNFLEGNRHFFAPGLGLPDKFGFVQ